MTALDIVRAVTHSLWSPYSLTIAYRCCALGPEADILVVQPSHYVDEIEIKVSLSDFRAELKNKADKHESLLKGRPKLNYDYETRELFSDYANAKPSPIRRFWFAVPEELHEKVKAEMPSYAGLIVVTQRGSSRNAARIVEAPNLPNSRKVTEAEMQAILRSMYARAWRQFYRTRDIGEEG